MVRLAFSLLFTKRMAGRPFAMHGSFEEDVMCSACDVHVLRCADWYKVRCIVPGAYSPNTSNTLPCHLSTRRQRQYFALTTKHPSQHA